MNKGKKPRKKIKAVKWGMLPAENVHILCAQVNYATSEELVKG